MCAVLPRGRRLLQLQFTQSSRTGLPSFWSSFVFRVPPLLLLRSSTATGLLTQRPSPGQRIGSSRRCVAVGLITTHAVKDVAGQCTALWLLCAWQACVCVCVCVCAVVRSSGDEGVPFRIPCDDTAWVRLHSGDTAGWLVTRRLLV